MFIVRKIFSLSSVGLGLCDCWLLLDLKENYIVRREMDTLNFLIDGGHC